jgi:hypothetical protein
MVLIIGLSSCALRRWLLYTVKGILRVLLLLELIACDETGVGLITDPALVGLPWWHAVSMHLCSHLLRKLT